MDSIKRIPIAELKLGMYIVGMDQPWYRTPFLLHKWLLTNPDDIAQLQRHGIREVMIDLSRGVDAGAVANGSIPPTNGEAAPPGSSESPTESPASCSDSGPTGPDVEAIVQQAIEAKAAYREAQEAMDRVFRDLEAGRPPEVVTLKNIVAGLMNRILLSPQSMMTRLFLEKMRRYDRTLASHGIDVCLLALIVGVEYGCSESDREVLGVGALLHDIGYVRLPRNAYRKSSALTDHEKALMQQHPQLAATVLSQGDPLPDGAMRIIAQHHEWLDGNGFPNKLKRGSIFNLAQLVGVVDAFDGMVAARHGRPPLLPHDAIRQLFVLGEKGRYDKALIEVAIKALGVYPIGSLIKLNTGERAVVTGLNYTDRLKPRIRIIGEASGDPEAGSLEIDLTVVKPHEPTRTILRVLDPEQEHLDLHTYLEATFIGDPR
jgi:HD-GYP domain-containing protein (c-di-GMP phosphodiesterase class II)